MRQAQHGRPLADYVFQGLFQSRVVGHVVVSLEFRYRPYEGLVLVDLLGGAAQDLEFGVGCLVSEREYLALVPLPHGRYRDSNDVSVGVRHDRRFPDHVTEVLEFYVPVHVLAQVGPFLHGGCRADVYPLARALALLAERLVRLREKQCASFFLAPSPQSSGFLHA